MATIEVGDSDLVLLVKADERSAGGVVFSPNLLVMVGDQVIGLVQRVKVEAAVEDSFPKVSIDLLSSEAEGVSDELKTHANKYLDLLKRLLPFISIRELGLDLQVLHRHGLNLDPG